MAVADSPINIQSLCRLCLSERTDSLKFIFDDALGPNNLPQKIQLLLQIEVNKNDKLSTMVCNDCIIRLDTWFSYKRQCHRNQTKLAEWLSKTTGQNVLDVSIHIKSEPLEDDTVRQGLLPIKMEYPMYNDMMDEEFNDLPQAVPSYASEPNDHLYLEDLQNEELDDHFKTAKRKLLRAEVTSNLNTEEEVNDPPQKRLTKKTKKISSRESEDDESKICRPPRLNFDALFCPSPAATPTPICEIELGNTSVTSHRDLTAYDNSFSTPHTDRSGIYNEVHSPARINSNAFQKKVLELLLTIKHQNIEMLSKLNKPRQLNPSVLPEDIPITFPVNSSESLDSLEAYLIDKDNLSALSTYLASLGGTNIASRVNRMMKFLLTYELASLFNFMGTRNSKRPFGKLFLCKAIIQAINTSEAESTAQKVEDAIKIWLKHAPERLKKSKNT